MPTTLNIMVQQRCPKATHISDFPIQEVSKVYRFLHHCFPDMKSKELDLAVLDYFDLPAQLKGQLAHLRKARHDALLCIIEDLTGAHGVHPQATTHLGTPMQGRRRWRRRHKRPPAPSPRRFDNWGDEDDAGLLSMRSNEPLDIPQIPGRLVMRRRGVTAYGFLIGTGFILGEGSMLVPFDEVEKYGNEVHFYNRFAWARYLDGHSRLKCDIELESANAAANLVAGRTVDGLKLWSLHERTILKELLP